MPNLKSYWYKARRFNFKYKANGLYTVDTAFSWQLPQERHAAVLRPVTTTKRADSVPVL